MKFLNKKKRLINKKIRSIKYKGKYNKLNIR